MQTVPDPATLFTDCARRMAFALRLQDAERKGTGVVLELNRSQFARDGLVAASSSFALTVRRSKLTPDEAARLATCLASRAPTDVWWRPVYTATRPETASNPPALIARCVLNLKLPRRASTLATLRARVLLVSAAMSSLTTGRVLRCEPMRWCSGPAGSG